MKHSLIWTSVLALGLVSAAAAAAPGTVLRNDTLYTQPSSQSARAGTVAKGSAVNILSKQGGWLRVTAGRTTGWIRLLSVRAGAGGLGGAGVGDVVGAATTRSDPSRVVSVAGLRGLNDEDLKQAKFNGEELGRLENWKVNESQARTFASKSGLAAANVPALPEPKPESSSWESN